jgi:hypothetical protein
MTKRSAVMEAGAAADRAANGESDTVQKGTPS